MVGKPGKRDRLYGLEERIAEYRELTNISIQHEIDIGMLSIDKNLSASVNSYRSTKSLGFSDYQKAASRLGYLFAPFDVPTIYRILGVKKL
jgi:hypothetical protein